MKPFVSIIIPCRNEEAFIEKCLNSILANDYPKNRMEILVVDGESTDTTRSIIARIVRQYSYMRIVLLHNEKKITPCALNIGIKKAKGEFIIRMDAHSEYKSNYISLCVEQSLAHKADNVGGIFASTPPVDTLIAHSIVEALSTFFGVGNSYFRTYPNHYKEVDTVAYGCYKRDVFERIGLYNENLVRCQDMDFNMRLKKAGGRIILFPDIIAYYYTEATFLKFWQHNFKDGVWAIYAYKFMHTPLKWRHLLPFFFVMGLVASAGVSGWLTLAGVGSYIIASVISSILVARRKQDIRYIPSMILAYGIRHFAYGIGSIWGGVKLLLTSK